MLKHYLLKKEIRNLNDDEIIKILKEYWNSNYDEPIEVIVVNYQEMRCHLEIIIIELTILNYLKPSLF